MIFLETIRTPKLTFCQKINIPIFRFFDFFEESYFRGSGKTPARDHIKGYVSSNNCDTVTESNLHKAEK